MKADQLSHLPPCRVPLVEIDKEPGPYCMSFGFDLSGLVQSIRHVGLINPPLLMPKEGGRLTIVTGYKRILAHREMRLDKIDCRILHPSHISALEALSINLYENRTVRTFNPVEKGMILTRLMQWVSRDKILFHYMPLLDLPSHAETLLFYHRIAQLDGPIKEALARGKLSMQGVKMLINLDEASRNAICAMITKLNFNMNQQTELIDHIIDISHIEKKGIPEVLAEAAIQDMVSNPHMNTPQKAKAILNHLRRKRAPTVVQAHQAFRSKVSSLHLPAGTQISAPSHFETDDLKLTILFNNGVQLQDKIRQLSEINALMDLNVPWKMP